MGMVKIKLNDGEVNTLAKKLQTMNAIRFDAVVKKNATQMLNAARSGGTPVDSGELRKSSSLQQDEVGYIKEYAAHVEYGHRTINGGYVQGQRFLQKNVDTQRPIYFMDLAAAIRKG